MWALCTGRWSSSARRSLCPVEGSLGSPERCSDAAAHGECCPTEPEPRTKMRLDFERHLRDYFNAWSRQDADAVMSFFSDASSFEDLGFAVKFEGLKEIRSFVDLTFAGSPDFQVGPTQVVVGAGMAAAAWTMSGTHSGNFPGFPATGRRFSVRACSMVTFDGSRIKTIVDYWNPVEFQQSVGSG